jgi:hyaluronan synthase
MPRPLSSRARRARSYRRQQRPSLVSRWDKSWLGRKHPFSWGAIIILIYLVLLIKVLNLQHLNGGLLLLVYSLGVSLYLLSRFLVAHFYEIKDKQFDPDYTPTVTFGVPSKNEAANIYETVMRIAEIDYPKDKFDVIVINDGSTDNTLAEMKRAKKDAEKLGVKVKVIDWKINQGKRHGMAACIKESKSELMLFVDSDSFIEKDTTRELIKYFQNPKVGATTAHCYVANENTNILTKMQAVRYFVAFKAYKGAESVFGTVTCCSGSCSAYRREYIAPVIDQWLKQKFLGITCTYGDDRSLTNILLAAGYDALYAPKAKVYTFAPDNMKQYLKQQLRWKKSWFRECVRASAFMWKRNPLMSVSFYLALILPLATPFVVLKALVWYPVSTGRLPFYYIDGVILMCVIYGLYYRVYSNDRKWLVAIAGSAAYSIAMSWQLVYAIATIRDSRWGTR